MNAVDELIGALPCAEPHEHMRLVAMPLKSRRQLGHMRGHAAHCDRVETLRHAAVLALVAAHGGHRNRPTG